MGWTFGKYQSKDYFIKDLLASFNANVKVLEHRVHGNRLWVVVESDTQPRMIVLFLLSNNGGEWGHKMIPETSGPSYYRCPKPLIEMCPDPKLGYSTEWRQKNAEEWDKYYEVRKMKPKNGTVLQYAGHDYKLAYPAGPRKGWVVRRVSDNVEFRMTTRQINEALSNG